MFQIDAQQLLVARDRAQFDDGGDVSSLCSSALSSDAH